MSAHFTVNTNGTVPSFGWQARAATRSERGRPRRTPANETPDRPAAQPRGRLRRSPFQRRQHHSSKVPQGAARALAGATSAWRGCSMTQKHTSTLIPNAKVGDTNGEKVGAIISHNVDVAGYTSAPRRHASVPRHHPLRDIACHFSTRYEAPSYDR